MHTVLTACDSAPDSPTLEPAPPAMGPLETFAEVVWRLFDEVQWHGLVTAYDTVPVDGIRLDVRPEPWQQVDPTMVYVAFRSGRMGVWHRFTAADLEAGAR